MGGKGELNRVREQAAEKFLCSQAPRHGERDPGRQLQLWETEGTVGISSRGQWHAHRAQEKLAEGGTVTIIVIFLQ